MRVVKDFIWKSGMTVESLVDDFSSLGFQAIELNKASDVVMKMKQSGAKIFLTFTSNMVTTGLRGFFAQLVKLGMADVLVTTSASLEEDIIKSLGDKVELSSFHADDVAMRERGENRIGNLAIRTESYMKFEDKMLEFLEKIYEKKKRIDVSELIKELGLMLGDENSILYQAARNDVPIFCPGIADSAIGFHLYMFQQKHPDFIVDVIRDVNNIILASSYDEKKGLISLGGSISKHYAIFSGLMNGGFDYAVYLTTSHASSGSMSGATTKEAMSWGKIKDSASAATVNGDVTINFPLVMIRAMEKLRKQGILK
ncbi:deoxyhypusine synthase [Candidatus Pacearchaeota archaeon CG10_big_fil_rev_8_21_14_0_10_35_219]|nr:deoxyhypusine synthase family protein [Candidatus Pacearchaeota archaeon]OIO42063.1 MAG: deoxyhypusine synthase [Candidatus Pacearchaeota archaeon CG1_02_35_32]PIO07616.1 MAG: deoxyhypusine synthase [Candidatus Pacearchaeota archaeon CG10_big_fil_rev_8_21_14_0_10_35_219]PIY81146.1 MAG: deoxyhypusine synthase [Candidatus Pacearchaeota archaeon CG_4_10_14_0_8_um_filter_35_169]PIZ79743.1 MAG: deoxyhypusine synthase [Candidatus Pacearchaeota archaeon CG_4_10_14_0_2_um_filter_35_33]PJA70324.1 MA